MRKKALIFDIDYEIDSKPVIKLFCIDEKGEKFLAYDSNFFHYFYILPKKGKENKLIEKIKSLDEKKIGTRILEVKKEKKILGKESVEFIKVCVENPRKISRVRDGIKEWDEVEETYEYNINFYRRYLIDKNLKPMSFLEIEGEVDKAKSSTYPTIKLKSIKPLEEEREIKPRVMAFDTEWIEKNGKHELIMLSIAGNDGFKRVITSKDWEGKPKWVESVANEKRIIERFSEILKEKDPVFLVGYNSDDFDFSRIKEKISELKMDIEFGKLGKMKFVRRGRASSARLKGIVHIDLFTFVNNILSASLKSEVLTLDEVAQELVGEKKKEMEYKEMVEIWKSKEKQLTKLAEYNLQDSILTLKLSELILPQIFSLSRLVGEIPFDCSRETYSQLVEQFFMREAFLENRVIPNSPKTEEKERRRMYLPYKGAIVIEPKKGIHSNILVYDFRSLYPTILVSHHISPETLNCEHEECKKKNRVPELGYHFCLKEEGFFPKHLKRLIELRKKIKSEMKNLKKSSPKYRLLDNRQYSLKIIANATYGYFAFIGARWYSRECAQAAAAFGRYYITKSIEMLKKENCEIIYGDTDSVFFRIPNLSGDELLERSKEILDKINKQFPGIIELEFRGLYQAGIFVTREKGEVGAKKRYALLDQEGNVEIRGFEVVRRDWCQLAKDIQRKVLTLVLKEKNPQRAVELVRETIKKLKERKVRLDELIIYEQITRPLSEYEQLGPHVKAAMKAKERGVPILEGSVIGYVIRKGTGSISDRAEPAEFVTLKDYDVEYYVHHQILPASMRVFKALGIREEQILSGRIQRGLHEFFRR